MARRLIGAPTVAGSDRGPASGAGRSRRRRAALGLLALTVAGVHGCITGGIANRLHDLGAEKAMPARIEVAYVRDMALTAPPVVAPAVAAPAPPVPAVAPVAALPASAPPAPVRRKKPSPPKPPPASPASAPEPALAAVSAPETSADVAALASAPGSAADPASAPMLAAATPAASAPPDTAAAASAATGDSGIAGTAVAAADAASAPADAASAPAAFEWPVSTRVSYVLTGNYRGEVRGDAQVEWVRSGARYQVHLDLAVGPSFAPVVARRMSSDGDITADGLRPRRYDQVTSVAFSAPRRATLAFEPDSVLLANGKRADSLPGLQDTASQFVQLTFLFSTRPELLRAGNSIDMPLALPHRLDRWIYDVQGEETLSTSFGELPTVYLKPRRQTPKPGELSAEIWFAPQLRYLPVRIRIRQDAETFIDLMIARPPQVAG